MKFWLDLNDKVCANCQKELLHEKLITSYLDNDICFCRECMLDPRAPIIPRYCTYVNTDTDGRAILSLDADTFGQLARTAHTAFGNERPAVINIPLCEVNPSHFPIYIIELYNKKERPYPQQRFLERRPDIKELALAAQSSEEQVTGIGRCSANEWCIFYKTDSPPETYECLRQISELLSKNYTSHSTVYMERSSKDPFDAARLMLASTGFKCIYCASEEETEAAKNIFKLSFTQKELFDYCRSRIIGQDSELNTAVFLVYNYLQKVAAGEKPSVKNWLLTAPSGMGKTEFYRCLADFFKEHDVPVPVIRYDLSNLTETGYKGENIDELIKKIYYGKPRHNKLSNGVAICFLDEADKKFTHSYTSKGTDMNSAAQSNLLTLIEGSAVTADDGDLDVDTSYTMFVFLGAFQNMRDKKKEEDEELTELLGNTAESEEDGFYGVLGFEDMIKFGLLEELAGRITMVINFRRLSEEDMRRLISEKAQLIGEEFNVSIKITSDGIDELLTDAYSNLGIRTPINKLKELVIETLAKCGLTSKAFDSSREEIVITGKDSAEIKHILRSRVS